MDPAELNRGEPRAAENRASARSIARGTWSAETCVTRGHGGAPFFAAKITAPESHAAADCAFLRPFLQRRVQGFGPRGVPGIISTDTAARDEKWFREELRLAFPTAYAEWGEWFVCFVQDLPHEKNAQLKRLLKGHHDYSSASFALTDLFSSLLSVEGVASRFDIALDASQPALAALYTELDEIGTRILVPAGVLEEATALGCKQDHIVAVHMRRILIDGSLRDVPPHVAAYLREVFDKGLIDGLPFDLLMPVAEFNLIVERSAQAFGLDRPDCPLAIGHETGAGGMNRDAAQSGGLMMPPRTVMEQFVRAIGREPEPRRAPVDVMHWVAWLASFSAWYRSPVPTTPEGAAGALGAVQDAARAQGDIRRGKRHATSLAARPVRRDEVAALVHSAKHTGGSEIGGGITDNEKHLKQVQMLTSPFDSQGRPSRPTRLIALAAGTRVARASTHGTVAAEQVRKTPSWPRSWANFSLPYM